MVPATPLAALAGRERAIIWAALIAVAGLAWTYLFVTAADVSRMSGAMATMTPWSAVDFALMFVMGSVMMVAMMLPSAAPMVLLYAAVARRARNKGQVLAPVGAFACGYIAVWVLFSTVATTLQWALEQAALLSPMMTSASPAFAGTLLIGAAVYQWTPLKAACLEHCRAPIEFLSRRWRPGIGGSVAMGLEHGAYCVGCCWALMALLFVAGVMNLLWVAAIAALVLVEKLTPLGRASGRAAAVLLAAAGLGLILFG